jgi:hypothetical protein
MEKAHGRREPFGGRQLADLEATIRAQQKPSASIEDNPIHPLPDNSAEDALETPEHAEET